MSYENKYLKYKNKYIQLKELIGGVNELKDLLSNKDILNEITTNSSSPCKEIISKLSTNKIPNIDWIGLDNSINIRIDNDFSINNKSNAMCNFITDENQKESCNRFYNKCKLKHLHNKYYNTVNVETYNLNVVLNILLNTIPNNNNENRMDDQKFLIDIGGSIFTSIPYNFYANYNLRNITLPNNLVIIGDDAFRLNHLTTVIIPNNVTKIGHGVFRENIINTVIFGNS